MVTSKNKEIIKKVKEYAELLKNKYSNLNVYLFGSQINNSADEDSDIDVAIISDSISDDIIEETFKLMKLRRKIDLRIEPHPFSKKSFEENPFSIEILKTGIKIL